MRLYQKQSSFGYDLYPYSKLRFDSLGYWNTRNTCFSLYLHIFGDRASKALVISCVIRAKGKYLVTLTSFLQR